MPEKKVKVANRQAYARISYLYQASHYLSSLARPEASPRRHEDLKNTTNNSCISSTAESAQDQNFSQTQRLTGLANSYASQISSISRKSSVKVSRDAKRSMCKSCKSLLRPGASSQSWIENKSKEKKKPWADVLVTKCLSCGFEKRYPIGAKRQLRKEERQHCHAHTDTMS